MANLEIVTDTDILIRDGIHVLAKAVKNNNNNITLGFTAHTPESNELLKSLNKKKFIVEIVKDGYEPNTDMNHQELDTLDWTERQETFKTVFRTETEGAKVQIIVSTAKDDDVYMSVFPKNGYKVKNAKRPLLYSDTKRPLYERLNDLVDGISNIEPYESKYEQDLKLVRFTIGLG